MSQESVQAKKKKLQQLKDTLETLKYAARDTTLDEVCEKKKVLPAERPSLKVATLLRGHFAKVYAMQWCKEFVVSASQDGKLIVWNAISGNKIHAIPLRSSWVMTCAYSPNGALVACGGLDNICSVYNLKSKDAPIRVTRELSSHTGYLSCSRFLGDRQILTSSGDMTCALWDVETGSLATQFLGHSGDVMCLSLSPTDTNTFVSGSCDTKAMMWDIRIGKRSVATFSGHKGDINAIAMFPNGNLFGTGSDDFSCKLFDIRALHELKEYTHKQSANNGITSVDFSRSGKYLFAGFDDFRTYLWDTLRHKDDVVSTLQGHSNRVSCLAVSPDGCAVCTGSWDNFLKVWAPA